MRLANWDGSQVRLWCSRIAFSPAFFKPSLTGAIDPIRRLFLSGPLEEFFRMGALKHGPNGPYRHNSPECPKSRHYGFHDVVDSEAMFGRLLHRFREERIVP